MTTALKVLKKATPQETEFYFKTLYPLQDIILEAIQNDAFYLTGGTALGRFYFQHHFPDDLDFFYDGFNHPKENFNFSYREILYRLEKGFDQIEITIDGEFFKRLFFKRNHTALKLEFVKGAPGLRGNNDGHRRFVKKSVSIGRRSFNSSRYRRDGI